jgi:hypothetical protein
MSLGSWAHGPLEYPHSFGGRGSRRGQGRRQVALGDERRASGHIPLRSTLIFGRPALSRSELTRLTHRRLRPAPAHCSLTGKDVRIRPLVDPLSLVTPVTTSRDRAPPRSLEAPRPPRNAGAAEGHRVPGGQAGDNDSHGAGARERAPCGSAGKLGGGGGPHRHPCHPLGARTALHAAASPASRHRLGCGVRSRRRGHLAGPLHHGGRCQSHRCVRARARVCRVCATLAPTCPLASLCTHRSARGCLPLPLHAAGACCEPVCAEGFVPASVSVCSAAVRLAPGLL